MRRLLNKKMAAAIMGFHRIAINEMGMEGACEKCRAVKHKETTRSWRGNFDDDN
jgi:hypothetical protein